MSIATESDRLVSRNPATGAELGQVRLTPPGQVESLVERARAAQQVWAAATWPERRAVLERWYRLLARDSNALADLISAEIGKPRVEALAEVATSLDALKWTIKHSGHLLAEHSIAPAWQRWLLVPTARVRWQPVGVVGLIGTWNYPIYLSVPTLAQALAAGCGIVWKPSELASLTSLRVQELLDEASPSSGLVSAVFGRGDVGQALLDAPIDKGHFTGGVEVGRHVLQALAARGIPAVAELSGYDAAIVLPDAPLAPTLKALAWGAFVGCGQTCVAVKRVVVVGDPRPWAEGLANHARALRIGDPAQPDVDLGPLISEAARDRFDRYVRAAIQAGARVLAGGEAADGPGPFYKPTVLLAAGPEPERALEGCFGPVVIVRGVPDTNAAIEAVNSSRFGLSASVWTADRKQGLALADSLRVGMVGINDAVTGSAHAGAPFGGVKASGHGRVHGVMGLREFLDAQTLVSRRSRALRPQVYPYHARMLGPLRAYLRLVHRAKG